MKKLIIAAAVILTAGFTSCKKDSGVQPTPTHKANVLADKSNLSQADEIDPGVATNDKSNLSQADGTTNPATGN